MYAYCHFQTLYLALFSSSEDILTLCAMYTCQKRRITTDIGVQPKKHAWTFECVVKNSHKKSWSSEYNYILQLFVQKLGYPADFPSVALSISRKNAVVFWDIFLLCRRSASALFSLAFFRIED